MLRSVRQLWLCRIADLDEWRLRAHSRRWPSLNLAYTRLGRQKSTSCQRDRRGGARCASAISRNGYRWYASSSSFS